MSETREEISKHYKKLYNTIASDYERENAGVTRVIFEQTRDVLPPITTSSIVHDNACGPGTVSLSILNEAVTTGMKPPTIFATDFSQSMVGELQRIIDEKELKTVTVQVMDGSDLSAFGDEMFTHSITNFGIFAFTDAVAGVKHIKRTLKPGGVAALSIWKHPGNIIFVNSVLQTIAPGSPEWAPLKEWMKEGHLRDVMEKAGFEKDKIEIVETRALWKIDDFEFVQSHFDSPLWEPSKVGLNEEQKGRWRDVVSSMLKERMGNGFDMIASVAVARK